MADDLTKLTDAMYAELDDTLAPVDRDLFARYPGDPGTRQPVHTVYVPADRFTLDTVPNWGMAATRLLDDHAPSAASLAAATGMDQGLVADVRDRIWQKLRDEPIEDLRVDFEDGYGVRPDEEEDAAAVSAARVLGALASAGPGTGTPPYLGIRFKCLERSTRRRGVRTLDVVLGTLLDAGPLPDGFIVTLPKVTAVAQVEAMVTVCEQLERAHGLPPGRLGFEIQVETPQAILAPDGSAGVARMIHAAGGRCTALHYGTFDYSAAVGITAAYQSLAHPVADHAKAVMQVAAAGTGVRLSDGSTNVLPVGDRAAVHAAWRLHAGLVRRSLERGYYQGWDMHPGHLPTRYLATYAFYREALPAAAARLRAYVERFAGQDDGQNDGQADGAVMDEPATAQALAAVIVRGLDCGAVDEAEVRELTGLDRAALDGLSRRRVG
jgi:citrate lyase beta subunit